MKQCSDEFIDAFDSHCAGCSRICTCGITHYDTSDNGWTWEEGELEHLEELHLKSPEKYVPHDYAIGTMNILGNEIVIGCSCDIAKKYENFIVSHRKQIAGFLNKRAENILKAAQQDMVEATIGSK